MRKERGFTLIELLIVLAILAILIGIVALSVGGLRETALMRSLQSEREVVETGLNAFVTLATPLVTVNDNGDPAKLTPGTDPEAEYLGKATRFWYAWENVGQPTQKVVVWSVAYADVCDAAVIGDDVIACDETACYKGDTEIRAAGLDEVGRAAAIVCPIP